MADPFFLLTLTGSAIGIALHLAVRRPKRSSHPLRTKRRRAIGVPVALIVAVVAAGGAVVLDARLILEWWRWALVLSGGVMLYTWIVLLTPRRRRGAAMLLVVVPILSAVDAWTTLPHKAGFLDLSCDAPSLALRANGGSPDGDPTLALVRLDPPPGAHESMALRVLPVVRFETDPGDRIWQPAGAVAVSDTIRIVATLERYPPPLWWLPGSERVSEVTISTSDHTTTLRTTELRVAWWGGAGASRTVEVVQPSRSDRFLQPGVYALEYSCGVTDTEDV